MQTRRSNPMLFLHHAYAIKFLWNKYLIVSQIVSYIHLSILITVQPIDNAKMKKPCTVVLVVPTGGPTRQPLRTQQLDEVTTCPAAALQVRAISLHSFEHMQYGNLDVVLADLDVR